MALKVLTPAQKKIKNRICNKKMCELQFQDQYSEYDDSNYDYSESFSWGED